MFFLWLVTTAVAVTMVVMMAAVVDVVISQNIDVVVTIVTVIK